MVGSTNGARNFRIAPKAGTRGFATEIDRSVMWMLPNGGESLSLAFGTEIWLPPSRKQSTNLEQDCRSLSNNGLSCRDGSISEYGGVRAGRRDRLVLRGRPPPRYIEVPGQPAGGRTRSRTRCAAPPSDDAFPDPDRGGPGLSRRGRSYPGGDPGREPVGEPHAGCAAGPAQGERADELQLPASGAGDSRFPAALSGSRSRYDPQRPLRRFDRGGLRSRRADRRACGLVIGGAQAGADAADDLRKSGVS